MALRLEDLVLRPAGREMRGNCPFCGDRKGHLYVNREKGLYHCFQCGASGRVEGAVHRPWRRPVVPSYYEIRAERIHEAYSALLSALGLSETHREHLMSPKRGLTEERIRQGGYATLPDGPRARIAGALSRDMDLSGIPGFYRKNGRWQIAGPCGLLVPVRNFEGQIWGLQIRPDDPGEGPKYCWLSSGDRDSGTKANAVYHVAGPRAGYRVWITEGPLKADIAAARLGETVVAVPGVNCWRRSGLAQGLKARGFREAIVAFDADAVANEHVARAAVRLSEALKDQGLRVRYAVWDVARGKGLDDLLLNGGEPRIVGLREYLKNTALSGEVMGMTRVHILGKVVAPPKFQTVTRDNRSLKKGVVRIYANGTSKPMVIPVIAWDRAAEQLERAGLQPQQWLFVEGKLHIGRRYDGFGEPVACLEVLLSNFEVVSGGQAPAAQVPETNLAEAPEVPF